LLSTYYPENAVVFHRPDDAADLATKLVAVHAGGQPLRARLAGGRDAVLRSLNWQTQQCTLLQCVNELACRSAACPQESR
jgi:hypothetical protein